MTKENRYLILLIPLLSVIFGSLIAYSPNLSLNLIVVVFLIGLLFFIVIKPKLILFIIPLVLPITSVLSITLGGSKISLSDTATLGLGFVIAILLLPRKNGHSLISVNQSKVMIWFVVIFVYSIIVSVYASYTFGFSNNSFFTVLFNAIITNARSLVPLFMILIVSILVTNNANYRFAIKVYLIGVIFSIVYAFYELIIRLSGLGDSFLLPGHSSSIILYNDSYRLSGPFGEPSYFAGYIVVSILVTVYAKKIFNKTNALNILLIAQFIVLGLTYSSVGFGALFIAFIVYLIANKRFIYIVYGFFAVSFILLIAFIIPNIRESLLKPFQESGADSSQSDRLNTMLTGVNIFKDHPILGVGNGNYHYFYLSHKPPQALIKDYNPIANNVYADILSAYGIIGTIMFAVVLILIVSSLRRIKLYDSTRLHYPFFLSLVVALGVLFMAYPSHNFGYIWFLLGILLYKANENKSEA